MEFNATFLVSIISFILFTLIMNKIFYKPIDKIISERQKFIYDALSDAKISNDKAEALLKDKDEKLQASLSNAKKLITENTIEADNKASYLTQDAKLKSKEYVAAEKLKLQHDAIALDEQLSNEVKSLAKEIAAKIMGEV